MSATAAAAAGSAAAALAGDSLNVRNYGKEPRIIAMWSTLQTGGFAQIAFPTGHDTTRGFRAGLPAANTQMILPLGARIPITPQETITGTIAGTAVAGDVENVSWLTRYDVNKGQRLANWRDVDRRLEKLTTIDQAIVSAAGPAYTGTALITAVSDLLVANRDYALLGITSRTQVQAIGITGPDTGNDRIAVPGMLRYEIGAQFFRLLSQSQDDDLIPVINSGNKGSTSLFVATDENAGTFTVTAHLALLKD